MYFMALYLPQPVFAHGQFYVACGRVGSEDALSIYIVDGEAQGVFKNFDGIYTRNVVYKEVFDEDYGLELEIQQQVHIESHIDEQTDDESISSESFLDLSNIINPSDAEMLNDDEISNDDETSNDDEISNDNEMSNDDESQNHNRSFIDLMGKKLPIQTDEERRQAAKGKRQFDSDSDSE